jgi:ATP-dependent Zn protease
MSWLSSGATLLVPLLLIAEFDAARPRITFNEVAGVDEANRELVEGVQFLKDPAHFTSVGAQPPRGVLLVGRRAWARARATSSR